MVYIVEYKLRSELELAGHVFLTYAVAGIYERVEVCYEYEGVNKCGTLKVDPYDDEHLTYFQAALNSEGLYDDLDLKHSVACATWYSVDFF
jgi:hypothetical protein